MKFEYGIKIYEPGQENILLSGFFVLPYFFVLRVTYIYIDIYKYIILKFIYFWFKLLKHLFLNIYKYKCMYQHNWAALANTSAAFFVLKGVSGKVRIVKH